MTRGQQIDDCWCLVASCGTAHQLAKTAREIIEMGIHLDDNDLKNFYEEKMLPKIAHYAGVPDEYVDNGVLRMVVSVY